MSTELTPPRWETRLPFSYGWINVVLASMAMTATLPGRTHGLGLITEPMLAELGLGRSEYAQLNFWSCLVGALLAVPVGRWIDRLGTRIVLAVVLTALAATVAWMSSVTTGRELLVALILVRCLAQSALSVISIAMISKWFSRRLGAAMGLFAVLLTFGFIASVLAVGDAVQTYGWRGAWFGVAIGLGVFAVLGGLLTRSTPEACGLPAVEPAEATSATADFSLAEALCTPHFWVFLWGTSLFNLAWSAITLFNESILGERGFHGNTAVETMAILTGAGLIANIVAGAFATRKRIAYVQLIGMLMLSASLAFFPSVTTLSQLRLYAFGIGLTGGVITVVFFAVWGHLFGRAHLGRIQSAAQLGTVAASAIGPACAALSFKITGSYSPVFYAAAAASGLAGMMALGCVNPPVESPPRQQTEPLPTL